MSKSSKVPAATEQDVDEAVGGETKPPDMPFFLPNDENQSVYRFILASAKRARQLQSGARPTISTTSRKPTKIGMEEVRTGAVDVEILDEEVRNRSAELYEQPGIEAPAAVEPTPSAD